MTEQERRLSFLREVLSAALASGTWSDIRERFSKAQLAWREDLKPGLGKPKYTKAAVASLDRDDLLAVAGRAISAFDDLDTRALQDALWWAQSKGESKVSRVTRNAFADLMDGRIIAPDEAPASFLGRFSNPKPNSPNFEYRGEPPRLYAQEYSLFDLVGSNSNPSRPSRHRELLDAYGFFEWPDQRLYKLLEALVAPENRTGADQSWWVEAIQGCLHPDELTLVEERRISGHPLFRVAPIHVEFEGKEKLVTPTPNLRGRKSLMDALGPLSVLAVGVSKYRPGAGFRDLPQCDNDALAIQNRFSTMKQLGGDSGRTKTLVTKDGVQPTRGAIMAEVRALAADAAGDERILFYFSGHGQRIKDALYLVPSDAWTEDDADALVSFDTIARIIHESRAKTKVFILDCCLSVPELSGKKGFGDALSEKFLHDYVQRTQGVAIIASSLDSQSSTTKSPNPNLSLFTYCLVDALGGNRKALEASGLMTLPSLFGHVSADVMRISKSYQRLQQPVFQGTASGTVVLGDFRAEHIQSSETALAFVASPSESGVPPRGVGPSASKAGGNQEAEAEKSEGSPVGRMRVMGLDDAMPFFHERMQDAFPGERGIGVVEADVVERLRILLAEPLTFPTSREGGGFYSPIWILFEEGEWQIEHFEVVANDVVQINNVRYRPGKLWANRVGGYRHDLVLMEFLPEAPTGLYKGDSDYEEYAIDSKGELYTRAEYDDCAAIRGGRPIRIDARLQSRYLRQGFVIITGQTSPVHDSASDQQKEMLLKSLVAGEMTAEDVIANLNQLPLRRWWR